MNYAPYWNYLIEYDDGYHLYVAQYVEKLPNGKHRIRLLEGDTPERGLNESMKKACEILGKEYDERRAWKQKYTELEVLPEEIDISIVWVSNALERLKKRKKEEKEEFRILEKLYGKEVADFYKKRDYSVYE